MNGRRGRRKAITARALPAPVAQTSTPSTRLRSQAPVRLRRPVAGLAWSMSFVALLVIVLGSSAGSRTLPAAADVANAAPAQQAPGNRALTAGEISEAYWEAVTVFAPTAFRYDSAAEIVADSHLIVRGRIVGVLEGAIEPFDHSYHLKTLPRMFAIVEIDEVLKGEPQGKTKGQILVDRLATVGMTELDLPKEEVILFLKNYAQERIDFGVEPANDPDDRFYYARPNGYQALLINRDGLLEAPAPPLGWGETFGLFPAELSGLTFAAASERLRATVIDTATN